MVAGTGSQQVTLYLSSGSRVDRKWNWPVKPWDPPPMTHFLQRVLLPNDSTDIPNSATTRDQVFTHRNLWGTVHIQPTASRLIIILIYLLAGCQETTFNCNGKSFFCLISSVKTQKMNGSLQECRKADSLVHHGTECILVHSRDGKWTPSFKTADALNLAVSLSPLI